MFTVVLSATEELVDKQLVILVHWLLLGGSPLARQNPNISLSECSIAEGVAEWVNGGVDVAEAVGNVPDNWRNEVLKINFVSLILFSFKFFSSSDVT
jgi:hypothetical protein